MLSEMPSLVDSDMAEAGLKELKPPRFMDVIIGPALKGDFATIAALESAFYLRNQLLRDSDWASWRIHWNSDAASEYPSMQILAPYLVGEHPRTKRKLGLAAVPRHALPAIVSARRKSGFTLPMATWLADSEVLSEFRSFPAVSNQSCH